MSRIEIFYATCCVPTQTVAPTLPGFQGIMRFVQYLYIQPHKPIFYPYTYYYGSNFIRRTWSGNQVEDYTSQNCLECHQYEDHDRIINRTGQFQVFFILCLVLLSSGKYRFNQL